MKKNSLKLTSKVLAGLVLLTGISSIPTNAVEVNNAAVDVNAKEVKVSVFEKDGHYYTKLTTEKEVANVVARIVVDGKAEFSVKKDLIKAGEVVEYELDVNAPVPTKKLPHTAVKKETVKVSTKVGNHNFDVTVRYEVATDEVKAQQVENKKLAEKVENAEKENKQAPATTDAPAKEETATEAVKPAETTAPAPAVETKKEEVAPASTPVEITSAAQPATTPVSTTGTTGFRSVPAAVAPKAPKAPTVMANTATTTPKATTTVAKKEVDAAKTQAPAAQTTQTAPATTQVAAATPVATAPLTGTREEQIRQAFLNKVNQLRAMNKLAPLTQNAALNASTKARANHVIKSPLTASVHGKAGSLEKAAAAQAGYAGAQKIIYNVAINTNSGTPEQVAQRLIDSLYHEINNVTTAFPYGHRNTLLNATSTEVGVGVTIVGNKVSLVQHQNNSGAFNGKKAIPSVYLDGKRY